MSDSPMTCEAVCQVMGQLISSDASVPDLAAAREHLAGCADCRAYMEQMQDDDRRLTDFASTHDERIRNLKLQAINALPEVPVRGDESRDRWRWIMANRTRGMIAAAAVIVFMVVFFQANDPSFDAWAEVVESVRKATTSQFRLRDMTGGDVEARQTYSSRGTTHRTYENGKLVEAMFVDFEEGEVLYMAYSLKLAARMSMTDDLVQDHRTHDPATTFAFITEYEHEDLGSRRIDGRRAVGIKVTDARFLAERLEHAELELWVDPETRLPIRFDVRGEVAGGRRIKHVRFDRFEWNEPLPDHEHHPEVPSDFDLHDDVDLTVDEAHALEGLRIFADVVGRYPSNLAYESLKVELWDSPGARKREVGDMVVDMFRIRMASMYYGELVKDDRAVVYFGDQVGPGDAERVLMRWRMGDEYRVVFGDLQTDTVSGEQLLELEASGR